MGWPGEVRMSAETAAGDARAIMLDFARLTGLDPPGAGPKRYLWTDAFAVCNYLGLYRETGDATFRDLAIRLVGQVHHTLGKYRADGPKSGWISGLAEDEGERHPTVGGLRIGKRLPERGRDEPPDERLEWDRDGQYYHYLTKWMHALARVSRVTGDPAFLGWAIELAKTAHARFTYTTRAGRRAMHWKMSIDLTYPLVPSMGQHDPLDGFVTYGELQQAARVDFPGSSFPDLGAEIADMAGIARGTSLATDDPLGTGGLLSDALWIAWITGRGGPGSGGGSGRDPAGWLPRLLGDVMDAALSGLDSFADSGCMGLPAEYRLAFRELGLSIGLAGVTDLRRAIGKSPALSGGDSSLQVQAEALESYLPIGESITRFWTGRENQGTGSWTEHREINMVMLATSLIPEGFLGI
jgi:hypothetical protein